MSAQKDSYAWLWVSLMVAALIGGIVYFVYEMAQPKTTVYLGDGIFTAHVASTDGAREKGLAGINELPKDKAMLFVFEQDGQHGVWMKGMKVSLDIVWLDSEKRVVHIAHDVSPASYPDEVYKPSLPARYVIELAAGTAREKSIRTGIAARFDDRGVMKGTLW